MSFGLFVALVFPALVSLPLFQRLNRYKRSNKRKKLPEKEGSSFSTIADIVGITGIGLFSVLSLLWNWLFSNYRDFTGTHVLGSIGFYGVVLLALALFLCSKAAQKLPILVFIPISLFFLIVSVRLVRSEAIASTLAAKAINNHDANAELVYIIHARRVLDSGNRIANPEELKQVISSTVNLLPSFEESSSSNAVTSLSNVGNVITKITPLVKATKSSSEVIAIEQGLAPLLEKISNLADEHLQQNVYSIDASTKQKLSHLGDTATREYLARVRYYLRDRNASGIEAASANYGFVRRISSVTDRGLEFDLQVLDLFCNALKSGGQVQQTSLFLRKMGQEVQASDLSSVNQVRAVEAIRKITYIAKWPATTKQEQTMVADATHVLRQWQNWAFTNKLSTVQSETNRVIKEITSLSDFTEDTQTRPKMPLHVYIREIQKIWDALAYHRGSWDSFGDCPVPGILINYHKLARNNQEKKWRQLVDIPDNPQVRSLQKGLKRYFYEAGQVMDAKEKENLIRGKEAQKAVELTIKQCYEIMRRLEKEK